MSNFMIRVVSKCVISKDLSLKESCFDAEILQVHSKSFTDIEYTKTLSIFWLCGRIQSDLWLIRMPPQWRVSVEISYVKLSQSANWFHNFSIVWLFDWYHMVKGLKNELKIIKTFLRWILSLHYQRLKNESSLISD